jgi:hypothetical protein
MSEPVEVYELTGVSSVRRRLPARSWRHWSPLHGYTRCDMRVVWPRTANCEGPLPQRLTSRGSTLPPARSPLDGTGLICPRPGALPSLSPRCLTDHRRHHLAACPFPYPGIAFWALSSWRQTPRPLPPPAWSQDSSPGVRSDPLVMTKGASLEPGRSVSARSDPVTPIALADAPRPPRGAEGSSSEPTRGGSRR